MNKEPCLDEIFKKETHVEKSTPLITCVLTSYNYEQFLEESLQSLLNQTYPNFEVVCIDDASTDSSYEIAKKYEKHPKLRLFRNKQNVGALKNITKATELARGEYIGYFSCDDKWDASFLSELGAVILERPQVAMCFSNPAFFSETSSHFNQYCDESTFFTPESYAQFTKRSYIWVATHAAIYKTEVIRKLEPFKKEYDYHCDWLMNYQIASQYPIAYVPKTLAWMRTHSQSFSANPDQTRIERIYDALCLLMSKDRALEQYFLCSNILSSLPPHFLNFLLKRKKFRYFFCFFIGKVKRKLLRYRAKARSYFFSLSIEDSYLNNSSFVQEKPIQKE